MIGDAKTQIVNDALSWLGNEPVVDLSDASLASSIATVKLMRVIERAREVVLGRHGWTCALEYATLAPATIANYVPPPAYPSLFLLPADAIRVWSIEGDATTSALWQGWEPRWQVGTTEVDGSTRLILRGAAPVSWDGLDGAGLGFPFGGLASSASVGGLSSIAIAYVRRADWASLDANLADAVSLTLAARGCPSISGDTSKTNALLKQAEAAVQLAIGSEANQEGGQPQLAASIPQRLRNIGRF